jgi:acetyltransferase-like isoleucine patch superfamily enzyme
LKKFIKQIIGYISTFVARKMLGGAGKELCVNFPCKFTKNTFVGNYCNFNGFQVLGYGHVRIGDYFHSGKEILVITENHNYEGQTIPYDRTTVKKSIIIEDCVWVGSRVTICGAVRLGEGCIVQAGSVVVNDIPKYAIAGGAPAKVFKYRDIEHYENLKKQNKFF